MFDTIYFVDPVLAVPVDVVVSSRSNHFWKNDFSFLWFFIDPDIIIDHLSIPHHISQDIIPHLIW